MPSAFSASLSGNPTKRRSLLKFGRFFGLKVNPKSKSYKRNRAAALHGQVIKYVTERVDGGENIIGRGGNVSVRNDQLLVFSSGEMLMRVGIYDLEAADLLSGDGVVLTGPNLEHGGAVESIVVHFVYYRK